MIHWRVGVALTAFLVGCAGPTFVVQQYVGPQRPAYSVAVLRSNARDDARVLRLDDEDVAAPIVEDGRLHVEMLPARHTVVVGRLAAPQERYPGIAFQAEAGRVYRVVFVAEQPHVYEVDRGSDALGRDVTGQ